MRSLLSEVLEFENNIDNYTPGEKRNIIDSLRNDINERQKRLSNSFSLKVNISPMKNHIEDRQKQEIKAIKSQIKSTIKYKFINNYAVAENFILNNHLNN
ncbi:MAG: hypothetical protein HRT69_16735 [Flavobacteriaceae bacterium]|nr:hypothetical protein [Flavobacteriaceae bacterium]